MKIAVIAPARHPVVEPYAGGLEAFCGLLVDHLRRRGHHVDLYAARGSSGHVAEYEFPGVDWHGFDAFASDVSYPPGQREAEDEAFRRLRHHLEASDYDVVHNNSLHPELLRSRILPLLTTLHCPPLAEMEEALADSTGALTAVSRATADSWNVPGPVTVIPNGVDVDIWRPRPGPVGEHAIWFGRLVPEKGAHVAIDACRRAGLNLLVVGRCGDPSYQASELIPRAGDDVRFLPPQRHRDLARLVGSAAVAAVTPLWDEPFGLVTVEAMAVRHSRRGLRPWRYRRHHARRPRNARAARRRRRFRCRAAGRPIPRPHRRRPTCAPAAQPERRGHRVPRPLPHRRPRQER